MGEKFEEVTTEDTRTDWPTPPEVIVPLYAMVYPDGVALDPCSNPNSIVGARVNLMLENGDDGLAVDWKSYGGVVYVNPPYGRAIGPWIEKCQREAARGVEIVALVPARVDTRWFGRIFKSADVIVFWRGRVKFLGAPDPAKFPSAVIYWGPRPELFAEHYGPLGNIVEPISLAAISSTPI